MEASRQQLNFHKHPKSTRWPLYHAALIVFERVPTWRVSLLTLRWRMLYILHAIIESSALTAIGSLILIRQEWQPLYLCWFTIPARVPLADGHGQIYQKLLWSCYGYPLMHLHGSITSTCSGLFIMLWLVFVWTIMYTMSYLLNIQPNFPQIKIFYLIRMLATVWPSEVLQSDFCQQYYLFPEETICRHFSLGDHNHTGPRNPPVFTGGGTPGRVQHSRRHGCMDGAPDQRFVTCSQTHL